MTENPFQLPGYQVIGMQDTGVAFDVHLQPPSPVACSSCGTIGDFVKNGTRDIRVMDLPVHGKPVTLWIARQRFQCKSCGSTFRPELPGIHPDAKMTERLHRECQDFCVWGGYSRGSPTRLPFVFEMQYARPDAIAGAKVEGPARSAGGSSLAPAIARREAAGALAREV